MRHIAIVPVKDKSDRVVSKNFRPFSEGKSLLETKLIQLMKSGVYDEIYVSSDSPDAQRIAKSLQVKFVERRVQFCNNVVPWSDVIVEVLASIPEAGDCVISWCHVTSPTFDLYSDAIKAYGDAVSKGHDGLIAVNRFSDFLVTSRGRPFNYSWGRWHEYSQDLEPLYRVTGALFMATKDTMMANKYVASLKPYLFECSSFHAVDVDTDFDFNLAKVLYENHEKFVTSK